MLFNLTHSPSGSDGRQVIDGDENLFTQSLLTQGQRGGALAAQQLTKAIANFLSTEQSVLAYGGRVSFWISIYFSKAALVKTLNNHDICTQTQVEDFLTGLSRASPRISLIDAGNDAECTQAKVRGRYPFRAHVLVNNH